MIEEEAAALTREQLVVGYDAHITRAGHWSDNRGREINAEEWLAYVARDPELRLDTSAGPHVARWSGPSTLPDPWLDWSGGNVFSKNPDPPLLAKMIEVARALDASVQGDDGERYPSTESGNESPAPPSLVERLRAWWNRRAGAGRAVPAPCPVGTRVRCPLRGPGVVTRIDRRGGGVLDTLTVRFDDGSEHERSLMAHGLDVLPD